MTSFGLCRVTVDGKFFRLGGKKFYVRGVTYGPFAPNDRGETFASAERTACDFQQIRSLGANVLRVYYVPPLWFLDLASAYDLKIMVDVPWPKHLRFLDSHKSQEEAVQQVRRAVLACARHPAIFAFSVVNEIPAEIVRWSGVAAVAKFIDRLVDEAKSVDPDCLCTFTSFPPTEFLLPQNIDFSCFNVYLHDRNSYEKYLRRLQMLADPRPLMLGEFGLDSFREGEAHKCEILGWQIESAFRAGLAGTIIFSYTDDWFRGGHQIEDWAFGLTTREREPKDSFRVAQKKFWEAPYFTLPRYPKVSVVVASYNGARTLEGCLHSLACLKYHDYEVILVDDGSTDETSEIARRFPGIHYFHQPNRGLSAARNTGIAAATGEIVAFTDSDCRADEDWLHYLVADLINSDFIGIGGHNFLPAEDSAVAAAVMVSPGGPAHVMLTDQEAEHIPGCNMAFYKWALDEIGGFDPIYTKAGDDVDVCWRMQQRSYKIGFSSSGFVWHHRRSTVKAYLKQQAGYGEAEALLIRKHPNYFNFLGGGIWRGRIYAPAKFGVMTHRPLIYHGVFGSGFFQKLYTPAVPFGLMFCTSLEYYLLITLPLLVLSAYFPALLPVALLSILFSTGLCVAVGMQAVLAKKKCRFWSRPLVASLFLLQPIVRGWSRNRTLLNQPSQFPSTFHSVAPSVMVRNEKSIEQKYYWSNGELDRYTLLSKILERLKQHHCTYRLDTGWNSHDIEIFGNRWSCLCLTTVTEELAEGRRNFCCRLIPSLSRPARIIFWLVASVEFILVQFFASLQPWLWMLFVTLPILAWFLDYKKIQLQRSIAALLDEVVVQQNMVIIGNGKEFEK